MTRRESLGDLDLLEYDELYRSRGWEVVNTVDFTWNGRPGREITYEKKRAPARTTNGAHPGSG